MSQDFYQILGVHDRASPAEIKQAYRALARKFHPDRNQGDDAATDKFKDAAEAYRVLGDPELRAQYDEFRAGPTAAPNIPAASTEATGDVLDELFGTSRAKQRKKQGQERARRKRRAPRDPSERGDDLRFNLEISFEDAVNGAVHTVEIPAEASCRSCRGTGAAPNSAPVLCQRCGGRGTVREQQGFFDSARRCPDCNGAGKQAAYVCDVCEGSGTEQVTRPVEVDVPAGVDTGTRLRVRGVGRGGLGNGPAGDLIVVLTVRPHPLFERDGYDLLVEVPVRLTDAALGSHVEIPTLDGPMRMRIPPGSQTGRVFRLQGKGLTRSDGRSRGDQRVRIEVQTPLSLTEQMRELLEQFADLEDAVAEEGPIAEFRATMARYYRSQR